MEVFVLIQELPATSWNHGHTSQSVVRDIVANYGGVFFDLKRTDYSSRLSLCRNITNEVDTFVVAQQINRSGSASVVNRGPAHIGSGALETKLIGNPYQDDRNSNNRSNVDKNRPGSRFATLDCSFQKPQEFKNIIMMPIQGHPGRNEAGIVPELGQEYPSEQTLLANQAQRLNITIHPGKSLHVSRYHFLG